jgi:hypothetical protein
LIIIEKYSGLSEFIHIVCLDGPSPPDYGGAMDMYYKIVALSGLGKKIILHFYDYNQNRNANGLERYCTEIHEYERKPFFRSASTLPYIVRSRINRELIDRLNKDQHPVLLEGLHCSGIIPYLNDKNRAVIRMHNEESVYYKKLADAEKNMIRRSYYELESRLLKRYYKRLDKDVRLACLSQADLDALKQDYHFTNAKYIPSFLPWQKIRSKEGKGVYCLYHGNLSVSENEAAANWLIDHVFNKTDMNLVIAGKDISKPLAEKAKSHRYLKLVNSPSEEEMTDLIQNAQLNILPSMNNTGVKFKILHALFEGRFCITNSNGIQGIDSNAGIHIADTADEFIRITRELCQQPFSLDQIKNRQQLLTEYDNSKNAARLNAIW